MARPTVGDDAKENDGQGKETESDQSFTAAMDVRDDRKVHESVDDAKKTEEKTSSVKEINIHNIYNIKRKPKHEGEISQQAHKRRREMVEPEEKEESAAQKLRQALTDREGPTMKKMRGRDEWDPWDLGSDDLRELGNGT